MDTLTYLSNKFNLPSSIDVDLKPTIIPNFGRHELAELFAELKFKYGAEIGVEQGAYSEILCKANPDMKLFAVDAWTVYRGYKDHTRQEKLDAFYKIARKRLAAYKCEIVKKFSLEAVNNFADESLDFVYIDANHDFLNVTNDLHAWSRKVKKGGIIAGHDYYKENMPSHVHVPYVLDGYTKAYNIRPWFIFEESWMFVKQ